MAFTQITVTGNFQTANGAAADGTVTFTPVAAMRNTTATTETTVAGPVVASIVSGAMTASLAATNDPGTTPEGVAYKVEVRINRQSGVDTYYIEVPYNGGPIDLATTPRAATVTPAMAAYLAKADADLLYAPIGSGGGGGVPADGSVTNVKVASNAAISADKLADGTTNKILTAAERTKLAGVFIPEAYGAAGDGVADDTTAVQAAVDAAIAAGSGAVVRFSAGKTYLLSAAINTGTAPLMVEILGDVVQTGNASAFTRFGSIGAAVPVTSGATVNSRQITVADNSAYAVDDWLLVHSSDVLPGTAADMLGCMRQLVSKTSTTNLFLDAAFYRAMPTSPQVRRCTLAAPIRFTGTGTIRHATPASAWTYPAIDLGLCYYPVVENITIRSWGDDAVRVNHVVGGHFNATTYDLMDDGVKYFGYGVDWCGATRGFDVHGSIGRVRHAVTTNVGEPIGTLGPCGEPEGCRVTAAVWNTSNKALDTHRHGWGLIFEPNIVGAQGGGIQIRADNTIVKGGSVLGCTSLGIHVTNFVTVPAVIEGTLISNTRTTGDGIVIDGPCRISDPVIRSFSRNGIYVGAGVTGDVEINNPQIDGAGSGTGIDLDGSGVRILGGSIRNCATGLAEDAAATGNSWSLLDYVGNTTNETRGTVYTQRRAALRGDALGLPPMVSGTWIAPVASSLTSGTHGTAGTITLCPIDVPDGLQVTTMATEITTAAVGFSLRLGIYESAANGSPGRLLATAGIVDGSVVGVPEVALPSTLTLRGGRYWLAALAEGTNNASTRKQQTLGGNGGTAASDVMGATTGIRGSYFAAGVATGSLPTTLPALSHTGTVTRIALKIA